MIQFVKHVKVLHKINVYHVKREYINLKEIPVKNHVIKDNIKIKKLILANHVKEIVLFVLNNLYVKNAQENHFYMNKNVY